MIGAISSHAGVYAATALTSDLIRTTIDYLDGRSEEIFLPARPMLIRAASPSKSLQVAEAPSAISEASQKRILCVPILFDDDIDEPFSRIQIKTEVFPKFNEWYLDTSYGKLIFQEVVLDWTRLPSSLKSISSYLAVWRDKAIEIGTAQGHPPETYDYLMLFLPTRPTPGFLGIGGGVTSWIFANPLLYPQVMMHEMGHCLGLLHAHRLSDCTNADSASFESCQVYEYGDFYDTMGDADFGGQFNAYEKEKIGLISSDHIPLIDSSGVYEIQPLEVPTATTHALKFFSEIAGKRATVYLEYRRPIGVDKNLAANVNLDGLLVRVVPTKGAAYAESSSLLDFQNKVNNHTSVDRRWDLTLKTGTEYFDFGSGIKVTPLSMDDNRIRVNIIFPEKPVISIPDQAITENQSFPQLLLDDLVSDPHFSDSTLIWSATNEDHGDIRGTIQVAIDPAIR